MATENVPRGIDGLTADTFYDASMKATGKPPANGCIFDKRMVVAIEQLPYMVEVESGEMLPPERLADLMTAGWLPPLAVEGTGEAGFALYAPSRIGLLLELERRGYGPDELQAIAAYEEGYIDNILVNEETPYLDDDRELLLNEWRWRLEYAKVRLETIRRPGFRRTPGYESEEELAAEMRDASRSLAFLDARSLDTMSPSVRETTSRLAFGVRWHHEMVRVMLLDHLRGQVRAGYSPYLHFRSWSLSPGEPPRLEGVMWDGSLQPWTLEEGTPIRLPDFRIEGDQVTLLRPLRPIEYQERWTQYALDDYLTVRARLLGERECPYCHAKLDPGTHEARLYCSEAHKQAAKMQRWRQRGKQPSRMKNLLGEAADGR
jgi:hypothetical protein